MITTIVTVEKMQFSLAILSAKELESIREIARQKINVMKNKSEEEARSDI